MGPRSLFLSSVRLLLLLTASQFLAIASEQAIKSVQNAHPSRWERGARASPQLPLTLRVALSPQKSDVQLAALVESVTDPASPSYGQHLTSLEELRDHFSPSEENLRGFQQLTEDVQVLELKPADVVGDLWSLKLSAASAEKLFSTKMFHYRHKERSGLAVVRPEESYKIPQHLQGIVTYVDGLESFPTEMQARFMQGGGTDGNDPFAVKQQPFTNDFRVGAQGATPAVIRDQYDIPDKLTIRSASSHAILNENATTSQVQRNKLVVGTFLREVYNEQDLRQFLHTIDGQEQIGKLPKTTGPCLSSKPTGEASLDIQVTAALTGHDVGDATEIEMMCYANYRDPTQPYAADNQEPFLTFLQDVNAMQPPPAVVSISYTDDECSVPVAYAEAVNRELMKTALRGISVLVSAGDAGVRGSHLAEGFCHLPSCSKFIAMFPASSPYVTAVGATTIASGSTRDGRGKWHEAVTSTASARALITSGGGFSEIYDMPSYQRKAVAPYLDFANTSGLSPYFRTTGRALPDVAAVGHAFPVVVDGMVGATDGTSVSAPVLASMVALLNRALPNMPPLGFLNPLFYRLYDVCPHVFADITQGDISCGSRGMQCCEKGHVATAGWDAASGLGTLRFSSLLNDLSDCIARMRFSAQLSAQQLLAASPDLDANQETAAGSSSWTSAQRRATQFLGVIAMVGAISLVGVMIALRERLFLESSDWRSAGSKRYGSCSAHDSAREYLLSHG